MAKSPVPYEIPVEMREFAEKSVEQAKKAFDGFVGAASKAVQAVETQTSSVQANTKDMASKYVNYAESNITAAFDHAQKLVRAKDVQELVQLQSEFVKVADGRHAGADAGIRHRWCRAPCKRPRPRPRPQCRRPPPKCRRLLPKSRRSPPRPPSASDLSRRAAPASRLFSPAEWVARR